MALLLVCAASFASVPARSLTRSAAGESPSPGVQPPSDASALDSLVERIRYPELEHVLHSARLSPLDRSYFEGVLADRSNHLAQAIQLLEDVLPSLKKSYPRRAAVALRTLAVDYFKTGRYADSCTAYADLLDHFAIQLSAAEKEDSQDNLRAFELVRNAVPQTVSGSRTFTVPWRRDRLGDIEVPLQAGSTKTWWIFDTGANVSFIPMTTARRLGLVLSKGQASTQSGATGKEIALRSGVIPALSFGDAVIHNVVVQVTDDKNLDIDMGKAGHYQIEGVLGYPALEALGSFAVSQNHIAVAPRSEPSPRSVRMYVEGLNPLLEIATTEARGLLFTLDTGATSSSFSVAYLRRFPQQFASLASKPSTASGAGGLREMKAYSLPSIDLQLGSARAMLKNVPVFAIDIGSDPQDRVLGNLGLDLLNQFQTYTIDFRDMRITFGNLAN